jgi:hypothetical protein
VTATSSKHIMERFTSEFLPTGDVGLAEEFLSPDVVMHFDPDIGTRPRAQGQGTSALIRRPGVAPPRVVPW